MKNQKVAKLSTLEKEELTLSAAAQLIQVGVVICLSINHAFDCVHDTAALPADGSTDAFGWDSSYEPVK